MRTAPAVPALMLELGPTVRTPMTRLTPWCETFFFNASASLCPFCSTSECLLFSTVVNLQLASSFPVAGYLPALRERKALAKEPVPQLNVKCVCYFRRSVPARVCATTRLGNASASTAITAAPANARAAPTIAATTVCA